MAFAATAAQTNKGLDHIAGRGGGLLSSDDLTDRQTRPNTSGRSFHSMKDPTARSKYAKPNEPQIDKELKDLIDSHADYHLVAYPEHIPNKPVALYHLMS